MIFDRIFLNLSVSNKRQNIRTESGPNFVLDLTPLMTPSPPCKEGLWMLQLPQIFDFRKILKIHENKIVNPLTLNCGYIEE